MAVHSPTGASNWSKITSFLNGLKYPEEALCIAPPVSNLCKGFVNTPLLPRQADWGFLGGLGYVVLAAGAGGLLGKTGEYPPFDPPQSRPALISPACYLSLQPQIIPDPNRTGHSRA